MWNRIKLWIINFFTGLYKKPLIPVEQVQQYIDLCDMNQDKYLSANEIWDMVCKMLKDIRDK